MCRKFGRAYFAGEKIDQEEDEDSDESVENEAENLEEKSESYIVFT